MIEPAEAKAPIFPIIAGAVNLARELLDVLHREREAIASMRLEAPTGFAEIKSRLVVAYRYKLEELQESSLAPGSEAALAELRALNTKVMDAARTNAAALEGAIEGNQRLLEIVILAVSKQKAPATVGYGRTGNRSTAPRRSPTPTSVMITRSL